MFWMIVIGVLIGISTIMVMPERDTIGAIVARMLWYRRLHRACRIGLRRGLVPLGGVAGAPSVPVVVAIVLSCIFLADRSCAIFKEPCHRIGTSAALSRIPINPRSTLSEEESQNSGFSTSGCRCRSGIFMWEGTRTEHGPPSASRHGDRCRELGMCYKRFSQVKREGPGRRASLVRLKRPRGAESMCIEFVS